MSYKKASKKQKPSNTENTLKKIFSQSQKVHSQNDVDGRLLVTTMQRLGLLEVKKF